jgi:hypothetical protein
MGAMTKSGCTAATLAVLVLASGCGGGGAKKHSAPPTTTVSAVTGTAPTAAPVAAATHKRKHAKAAHARHKAASRSRSSAARSSAGHSKPSTPRPKPLAIVCLQKANISGAHSSQPGQWIGKVGSDLVVVDGPYKTPKAAANSANTLTGAAIAESGGIYVTSATIASGLTKQVHRVALCLGNGIVTRVAPADPNANPLPSEGGSG